LEAKAAATPSRRRILRHESDINNSIYISHGTRHGMEVLENAASEIGATERAKYDVYVDLRRLPIHGGGHSNLAPSRPHTVLLLSIGQFQLAQLPAMIGRRRWGKYCRPAHLVLTTSNLHQLWVPIYAMQIAITKERHQSILLFLVLFTHAYRCCRFLGTKSAGLRCPGGLRGRMELLDKTKRFGSIVFDSRMNFRPRQTLNPHR
jgi:hypothetical protein